MHSSQGGFEQFLLENLPFPKSRVSQLVVVIRFESDVLLTCVFDGDVNTVPSRATLDALRLDVDAQFFIQSLCRIFFVPLQWLVGKLNAPQQRSHPSTVSSPSSPPS